MPLTHFPNGVSSFGQVVLQPGLSVPNLNGSTWFVDTTNGSDGNPGTSPDTALKTIARALVLAGSGTGDTIFVYPGTYAENLSVTKNYITIIGANYAGYARPDITPTTGVPLTVTGQGFMCVHVRLAGTAADTLQQKGNGFLYNDCVFDGDATANKGVRLLPSNAVTSQTASEGVINNSLFRGFARGLLMDTSNLNGGSTDNVISNNIFQTNTLDITAEKTGAAGTYSVKTVTIIGNQFIDKNKATYIDITTNEDGVAGNQTGAITGNYFASDTITTTKIKMVGTGFTFGGNLDTVGVVDGSGID